MNVEELVKELEAQKAENHTNLRSEKQFSNEVRRETTHIGLVPVNAGWYQTLRTDLAKALERLEEANTRIKQLGVNIISGGKHTLRI